MLLPSALSCDSRQYPSHHHHSRFTASRLFPATPPPSVDDNLVAGNGLLGTCRALQSLLNASPASSPRRAKPEPLQSPLQVRTHPARRPGSGRVAKLPPPPPPPRGQNKRRRDAYEDDSDDDVVNFAPGDGFSTPKRRRRAPFELPLGLDVSDFRALESPNTRLRSHRSSPRLRRNKRDPALITPALNQQVDSSDASSPLEEPASDWTVEDDRQLVELVLEKLKLSKRDWSDCARRMGKDNDSVGRRWKALVGEGNVGLRRGRRMVQSPLPESWR